MEKKKYIAPQTMVCLIQGEELLNTISTLTGTNTSGLGISNGSYEGEGRTKGTGDWSDIWTSK